MMPYKKEHFMETALQYTYFNNLLNQIETAIQQLCTMIKDSTVTQAYVYQIPRVLKENESIPYKHIPVTELTDQDAITEAIKAFKTLYLEDLAFSAKSIGRWPGVIAIHTSQPQLVIEQIHLINELKSTFQQQINLQFDNNHTRYTFLHRPEHFPGLITTYVTRHIAYFDQQVQSVSFSWVNKKVRSKITLEEAIEKLKDMKGIFPEGQVTNDLDWDQRVNLEITRLQSLPADIDLRLYRKIKLKPLINVLFDQAFDDQPLKDRKRQREGHLPLILINPGEFKIGSLTDYPSTKSLRPGRIATEPELLSKMIPIYEV